MTDQVLSDQERLVGIFLPYTLKRRSQVRLRGIRFVHYTSAEAAMGVLKDKSVWMRNSTCMNDYTEVSYGLRWLLEIYGRSEGDKQFKAALNQIFPGMPAQIEEFPVARLFLQYLFRYNSAPMLGLAV